MTDDHSVPQITDAMFDAVEPFYLDLLHVNIARGSAHERGEFIAKFAHAARTISDDLLASLLSVAEWRSRMVAGWMVAVTERRQHLPVIRRDLAEADLVYPHGLLIALATLPDEAGARALAAFLDRWLAPEVDHHHDQPWVLATLEEIDGRLGTHHAAALLEPGGPWETWARDSASRYREAGRSWLATALTLVEDCRSAS